VRAREPDVVGEIVRDGVRVGYDAYGDPARPCVVLLTSWAIVHMRQWKLQVPYLARHFHVVTVEGRGNGRADRPQRPEAYADEEYVADALAVLDALGVERAVLVGLSMGGRHALQFAVEHPDRAAGVVALGTAFPWPTPEGFDVPRDSYEGWQKANLHYWLSDYAGWVEFFMSQVFTEPYSSKQWEDGVVWGLETDALTLLNTAPGLASATQQSAEDTCRRVRCPVLVVHGEEDAIVPVTTGAAIARWTGGEFLSIPHAGHGLPMRQPVLVNRLIREFAASCTGPAS
jgi:pimeloyl-ACP methyl ester carboxylesterase